MRYIEKGSEPPEFTNWKATQRPEPVWESLSGNPAKDKLRDSLLREQGYICCYCGKRTEKETSHIEHLRPQNRYPDRALEYSNLLASCEGGRGSGTPARSQHCGHRKNEWFDCRLMVSPLDPDCEKYFSYLPIGQMEPADDNERRAAASETIRRLGLNSPLLTKMRWGAWEGLARLLADQGAQRLEAARKLMDQFSRMDDEGRYKPFCAAIVYWLRRYGQRPEPD